MNINKEDLANINSAISAKEDIKIWVNPVLDSVKRKIKDYYRSVNNVCCYCRRSFNGEFNMVIDIEHILPKSKFEEFMFSPFNLNISCKRCNMQIKGESVDFLIDPELIKTSPKNTKLYKFIHPNFDIYEEHLDYLVNIHNRKQFVKYQVNNDTPKGEYTYDFFRLNKLEIDTLNEAQGIKKMEELSSNIDSDIVRQLENILK